MRSHDHILELKTGELVYLAKCLAQRSCNTRFTQTKASSCVSPFEKPTNRDPLALNAVDVESLSCAHSTHGVGARVNCRQGRFNPEICVVGQTLNVPIGVDSCADVSVWPVDWFPGSAPPDVPKVSGWNLSRCI